MDLDGIIRLAQEERFNNGDIIKAEKLLLEAAEVGSGHAAHELGVLYICGKKDIKPDYEKSQYWLENHWSQALKKQLRQIQNGSRKNQFNNSLKFARKKRGPDARTSRRLAWR